MVKMANARASPDPKHTNKTNKSNWTLLGPFLFSFIILHSLSLIQQNIVKQTFQDEAKEEIIRYFQSITASEDYVSLKH